MKVLHFVFAKSVRKWQLSGSISMKKKWHLWSQKLGKKLSFGVPYFKGQRWWQDGIFKLGKMRSLEGFTIPWRSLKWIWKNAWKVSCYPFLSSSFSSFPVASSPSLLLLDLPPPLFSLLDLSLSLFFFLNMWWSSQFHLEIEIELPSSFFFFL
jgi:hypothetical protein